MLRHLGVNGFYLGALLLSVEAPASSLHGECGAFWEMSYSHVELNWSAWGPDRRFLFAKCQLAHSDHPGQHGAQLFGREGIGALPELRMRLNNDGTPVGKAAAINAIYWIFEYDESISPERTLIAEVQSAVSATGRYFERPLKWANALSRRAEK